MKDIDHDRVNLYAKLEYTNFSGSSKDRAAYSMLYHGIVSGRINAGTTVVASSSGNLAIALGLMCRHMKIRFIPVIDTNINREYEMLLDLIATQVVKVTRRDETGGFLLTRIDRVNDICSKTGNVFCADQYADVNNYRGYHKLADELLTSLDRIDYIFVGVSSGGAITGISQRIKQRTPKTKVIAVDVEGSVIFGLPPEKRYVSGIGSSMVPPILRDAVIDEVIHVSQPDVIKGCYSLLGEHAIFAGASSGAVYFAARRFLAGNDADAQPANTIPTAVMIFPDRGNGYLNTIYDKDWERNHFGSHVIPSF